jgi:hypothetical protein
MCCTAALIFTTYSPPHMETYVKILKFTFYFNFFNMTGALHVSTVNRKCDLSSKLPEDNIGVKERAN